MRLAAALATLVAASLVAAPSAVAKEKDEWGKDIPFTTSWKDAIKSVRESGKILMIYNGWKAAGI